MVRFLNLVWQRWLKIAAFLGTIQMILLLNVIYWVLIPWLAIPLKIFSDPLALKRRDQPGWRVHSVSAGDVDTMRRQG
jgi:hypothetical protein